MGSRRFQLRRDVETRAHGGSGAGRAGGTADAGASGAWQGAGSARARLADVSGGDDITGAAACSARQRESLVRSGFTGVSRGDGITGATASSAGQRGFSLIEIILVVVLIGGIVAFAATRILGGGDRARVNLARAQVQTIADKVSQFEMDTGALPASLDQLVTQPGGAVGWLGPYAKESELRDPWNTPLEYRAPGDGKPYDIVSYGADRKPGGDSVDADIRND
jgi:general secretion pathway protein G